MKVVCSCKCLSDFVRSVAYIIIGVFVSWIDRNYSVDNFGFKVGTVRVVSKCSVSSLIIPIITANLKRLLYNLSIFIIKT